MPGWRDRTDRDYEAPQTPASKSGAGRWALPAGLVTLAIVAFVVTSWPTKRSKQSPIEALMSQIAKIDVATLDDRALKAAGQLAKKARRTLGGPKVDLTRTNARRVKNESMIKAFESRLAGRAKDLEGQKKKR